MKGLDSRRIAWSTNSMRRDHRLRVSGHVQHADLGAERRDPVGDLLSGHPGHDNIREQQVDRAPVIVDDFEGLGSAPRHEDVIAMLHQNAVRHIEDKFFIFDDNNRLPCSMSHGWSRFFALDDRCLDTWQENHHRGPGTHLRTQLHEPPV